MSTGCAVSSTATHHVGIIWVGVVFALSSDLQLNRLADRQLARALADLCQVGTTEAMRHFRQVVNVHVLFIIFTMWFTVTTSVLPSWYRLTRVVPDKGPLNRCVCAK